MNEESTSQREPEKADPRAGHTVAIDWALVHQRLEAAQAALEGRMAPGREERQSILRARAKSLAREPEGEETPFESLEVVEFLLAHEHYAIESKRIREIQPLRDLTPLPCTPSFVLGLINVRGQILSVIDIKTFFDLPKKGLTDLNKVIVVRTDRMEVGILADDILGARSIPLGDLQPSLPTLTDARGEFLRGVTKDSMVVLDIERILSDSRMVVDGDARKVT